MVNLIVCVCNSDSMMKKKVGVKPKKRKSSSPASVSPGAATDSLGEVLTSGCCFGAEFCFLPYSNGSFGGKDFSSCKHKSPKIESLQTVVVGSNDLNLCGWALIVMYSTGKNRLCFLHSLLRSN